MQNNPAPPSAATNFTQHASFVHNVPQPDTMYKAAPWGSPAGSTKLGAGSTGFGGPLDRMEAESASNAASSAQLQGSPNCLTQHSRNLNNSCHAAQLVTYPCDAQ